MLQEGIIIEYASLWSIPIVVVPKPDSTIRLCNDICRLNQVKLDSCYFPQVDDLMERLWKAWYISTLDLTKNIGRCHWILKLGP